MKIWNVNSGPYENDDGQIWNLCLVEDDNGVVTTEEIYYETMEDAWGMLRHFQTNIEPLDIQPFEEPRLV